MHSPLVRCYRLRCDKDRSPHLSYYQEFSGKVAIRIGKTYLAIVRSWAPEALVIDHPLVEKDRPPSEMQPARVPPAQPAITDLRRLATVEGRLDRTRQKGLADTVRFRLFHDLGL